ncbi:MAG: CCA tRNA nucleotidyltransferase [Lachnospiraceae bacterium]|nr:CCA tRNA nucleotidyltransferase [Lachnospiraceae bacterium]
MQIQLPDKVQNIINTLEEAGYEAYAVGGCVRDSMLGRKPDDWDITTSAKPEEMKRLFPRTVDTGIKHGTVTVLLGGEGFEVTTYRIDGVYEDGRHPTEVNFTSNLKEDLRRRDFTINAMAYNARSGLVDLYGGLSDMENRVIRCVGDAKERFDEDALRMLRAVRFSAQLGFRIDEATGEAVKALATNLQKISAERIQVELVKLVISPHPDYLRTAYELGITAQILPEFDLCMETPQRHKHHCYDVGEHILHSMLGVGPDKVLRLGMLFHDIGKPQTLTVDPDGTTHNKKHPYEGEKITRKVMRRLKFDNDTTDKVTKLVLYHDYDIAPTEAGVRRAINRMGEDIFAMIFTVRRADIAAQSDYMREEKLAKVAYIENLYREVLARKDAVTLKDLAISGNDLIAEGMPPGRQIGETLSALLERVLDDPSLNTREILLKLYKEV